jgi:hypothetical protein
MSATSITDLFLLHGINNIRIASPSLFLRYDCKFTVIVRHTRKPLFIISPSTIKLMHFFRKPMPTIPGTVQSVSSDRTTSRGLWPPCSPSEAMEFFLVGHVKGSNV